MGGPLCARSAKGGLQFLLLAGDGEGGVLHGLNKLKPLRRAFAPCATDKQKKRSLVFPLGSLSLESLLATAPNNAAPTVTSICKPLHHDKVSFYWGSLFMSKDKMKHEIRLVQHFQTCRHCTEL